MFFYKKLKKNPMNSMDFFLLLFCVILSKNMCGDVLSAHNKKPEKEQWEKVFTPRVKHNLIFFAGSSSGDWEPDQTELPKYSTDFILSYRYYLRGINKRTSFFLGSNLGYSIDSKSRLSNYSGEKVFLPGLLVGLSYFFSIKFRASLSFGVSLTRYYNLKLNEQSYKIASENLGDSSLSFEYFVSQDWGLVTCLNFRREIFSNNNLSFNHYTRSSWGIMAGITYHKL